MESDEMVECPHSSAMQPDFSESYVVHRVPRSELLGNGGVCGKCRAQFAARNRGTLKGRPQSPAEIQPHHRHDHDPSNENVAFDENHETVGVVDFDYDQIDRDLGFVADASDDARRESAEIVRRLMVHCWQPPFSVRQAFARFSIISSGLFPEVCTMSFKEIAQALSCTKQNISKAASEVQKLWGLKLYHTRNSETRQKMRTARLKNPVGRNVRATPAKDSFNPGIPNGSDRTP